MSDEKTQDFSQGLVPFECVTGCGYYWWEHSSGGEICPQCGTSEGIVQGLPKVEG